MTLRINDTAPDFVADSTEGRISFHEAIGDGYAILFSHPKDFTPVCTTEFGAVAQLAEEFAKRNTKVFGVSVDPLDAHEGWKADIEKYSGRPVTFPMFADPDLQIAKLYDMMPAESVLPDGRTPAHTATVRSTFIIGPDKKVRVMLIYPMTVGRNFQEILRALDAVRATEGVPFATPADWKPGDKAIVALSVPTDEAQQKFPDLEIVLPYVRKASLPAN
ncbi:peroxiredoxin [Falsigemmobacter faecalis]|uniref:Alkyl hydroperoxide reductase C n=1 Tax=Falsigemmobacter faecalis TaxID=2488730 RepID=A0A3P3DWC3_9RHOB|nr:peroxiredoxin [Falsigemmobacter faecalis]RRH78431.1 peroxiredoxin [Falsigemmobacter faecalis]